MRRALLTALAGTALCVPAVDRAHAQSAATPVPATLNQLMRGTLYPSANVVFAAQDVNPADIPRAKDPNMATDLLTTVFGKWEAVENSALAISEVANLLTLPGRKCSNGLDVPVKNADWDKFVQQLRDAGMTAYAAAKTKDQDKMTDAAGVMTTACANCHNKYREKRNPADRCK
ncbi:MAG: cytochrome c [Acidobacteriia bacterium]|nr:cytochrome c [Terriglobia bacterium]